LLQETCLGQHSVHGSEQSFWGRIAMVFAVLGAMQSLEASRHVQFFLSALCWPSSPCCPAVHCADLCLLQAHRHSCTRRQGETCICCLLESQLFRQLYGNRGEFRPDLLYSHLLSLSRGFVRGRQEDAHELLRCLTDELERCLLRQSLGYNPQRMPRVRRRIMVSSTSVQYSSASSFQYSSARSFQYSSASSFQYISASSFRGRDWPRLQ
jgi:hypothetical protein